MTISFVILSEAARSARRSRRIPANLPRSVSSKNFDFLSLVDFALE
jgi:hypothetical protein